MHLVGLEPTRDYSQRILSPSRIPVPTQVHITAPAGFEPANLWIKTTCLTAWLRGYITGLFPIVNCYSLYNN